MTTVYEAAGGADGLLALARAWQEVILPAWQALA